MGMTPQKHGVIITTTQQYTNTKYVLLERYLVVSIMLRYMDQIKIFSENSGHHEVKFDIFVLFCLFVCLFFFLGGGGLVTYRTLL